MFRNEFSSNSWIIIIFSCLFFSRKSDGRKIQNFVLKIFNFNRRKIQNLYQVSTKWENFMAKFCIELQLIEEMLGADWSLSAPSLPDVRIQHVQQLRKLFASIKGRITHLNDWCVIFYWSIRTYICVHIYLFI